MKIFLTCPTPWSYCPYYVHTRMSCSSDDACNGSMVMRDHSVPYLLDCYMIDHVAYPDNQLCNKTTIAIGHVNKYPTMLYFGIPIHIQSMIAYKIL